MKFLSKSTHLFLAFIFSIYFEIMQNVYNFIDLEYLSALSADKVFIRSMLETFVEQWGILEKSIETAIKNQDNTALGAAIHKAKSSVAIVGMTEDAEKLNILEEDIATNSNTDSYSLRITHFFKRMKNGIDEARLALNDYQ